MEVSELAELLESGVAMLGAWAGADLVPEAFRVWGASVDEGGRLRALASADASRTVVDLAAGSRVAVVLTDITSFRSVQVKGSSAGPAALPGPGDVACMRRYNERFAAALAGIGHPPSLFERLRPPSVFVVSVEIDTLYDQTPGPTAGVSLGVVGRG
jgi:hypothetical protein